jgi:hypothetical protein
MGFPESDDERCTPQYKNISESMRKSWHITKIRNRRWRYRDIKEYSTADQQNLTGDSIQQGGVVGSQSLLGEIVNISLLYRFPDVAFCSNL